MLCLNQLACIFRIAAMVSGNGKYSQSPRTASAIAHTRTRRDCYPDCLLIHITRD
jgi:hypothetical protein